MPQTKERPAPVQPIHWIETDFGDGELIVREFSDGNFILEVNDERLIVSQEQMSAIVLDFLKIARAKGWGTV